MTIVDQGSDVSLRVLSKLLHANPDYVPILKMAAESKKDTPRELTNKDFAWPEHRAYNITSPKDAILSKLYASMGEDIPGDVLNRIDNALNLYNVKAPPVSSSKKSTKEKAASTTEYMLPAIKRGVINTAKQLKEAQELLHRTRDTLSIEMKTEAAVNLVKRAEELKVPIHRDWIYKQAGLTYCHRNKLIDWLEARRTVCKVASVKDRYDTLIKMAHNLPFWYYEHNSLVKLAGCLSDLDKEADLEKYYGKKLLDPVHTVFNSSKVAGAHMNIQGKVVPNEKLLNISPESYGDILGDDVVPEITDNGNLDIHKLSTVIDTLPKDLQLALLTELGL